MTALDRAFIKAYSHHWRGPAGAAQPAAASGPPSAHFSPSQRPAIDQPPAPHQDYGAHHPSVEELYAPHDESLRLGAEASAPSEPPLSRPARSADTVKTEIFTGGRGLSTSSTGGLRPLSSFAAPQPGNFRPLLEVDGFEWPAVCGKLTEAAETALERFAENLLARAATGHKMVAIGSMARGHGATTAAICIARAVAKKADCALVDADFANPELARRLGVLAESGWDDAARGDLPLAEVVIASTVERVVLAPLSDTQQPMPIDADQAVLTLGILHDCYPLILLDVGPLADFLAGSGGLPIDSIYLVRDRRAGTGEPLETSSEQWKAAGVTVRGIIDNFAVAATQRGRT